MHKQTESTRTATTTTTLSSQCNILNCVLNIFPTQIKSDRYLNSIMHELFKLDMKTVTTGISEWKTRGTIRKKGFAGNNVGT